MITMDQELAAAAYEKAEKFGKAHKKDSPERKQYGSMAHKLPVLIRTAGLAQALSFVQSRGKNGHQKLLDDLSAVVLPGDTNVDLCTQSREVELQSYIYLTRRSLLALKWFKRFAESVLEVGATEEGQAEQ